MSGSWLQDILTEIGITTSGSVWSILAGKNYEHGLICHKAVIEFLEKSMYDKFRDNNDSLTKEGISCLKQLVNSPSGEKLATVMASDDVRNYIDDNLQFRKEVHQGALGWTAQLWVSYFNNVWLILQLIEAVKRNFETYSMCTKMMLDTFFATNMQNYAWFLTYEGEFFTNIESTHPGSEQLLLNGAIGAARSYIPGNQAQINKTGEKTIMQHTKASCGPGTAAVGLGGITTNPEAYQRHILTTHERVTCVEFLLICLSPGAPVS